MPKLSRWKAQHVGCQKAVDDLKADLTNEISLLETRLQIATQALEHIHLTHRPAEPYPGAGATTAEDALIQMSVVE